MLWLKTSLASKVWFFPHMNSRDALGVFWVCNDNATNHFGNLTEVDKTIHLPKRLNAEKYCKRIQIASSAIDLTRLNSMANHVNALNIRMH